MDGQDAASRSAQEEAEIQPRAEAHKLPKDKTGPPAGRVKTSEMDRPDEAVFSEYTVTSPQSQPL
jgi:hypothetical protein